MHSEVLVLESMLGVPALDTNWCYCPALLICMFNSVLQAGRHMSGTAVQCNSSSVMPTIFQVWHTAALRCWGVLSVLGLVYKVVKVLDHTW